MEPLRTAATEAGGTAGDVVHKNRRHYVCIASTAAERRGGCERVDIEPCVVD